MDDQFTKRVRAAARAGWWTLLLVVIFATVQWQMYLYIMSAKPEWMMNLMFRGAGVTWETIASLSLWIIGAFKLCIWLLATVVVWLSLWGRRLRKVQ